MNYAEFGWATFPCHGKIPATKNGFKDADKTGEVFKKYKGENIGISAGAVSQIWILDIDVKHGAQGAESLKKLTDKHGALPVTVMARTWSGGLHYYFKLPAGGMGNRTNVLPGIDVRGDGGYVIAPPSIVEGKPYEWITPPGGNVQVADAPAWLLHLLEKATSAPTRGLITEGNRNSELTSRAGKMRAVGMEHSDIFMALLKINAIECSPPLPERDVRVIAESVSRYQPASVNVPLTDVWNAERFAERHTDDIRWCPNIGWLVWNGMYWERKGKDDTTLLAMAMSFIKGLSRQAESINDARLKKWAAKSESSSRISATVELAKGATGMTITAEALDNDAMLINCANGTVDLKTGNIRNADRKDHITRVTPVKYDPAAICPTWMTFLQQIFQDDSGVIDYVQRAMGYCLSGVTTEQKFFICFGNGRNGKSTLLKHMMYMLGDGYAAATPAETMLESSGNTLHAVASLKGKRLVVLNEFDEGKVLSSAQVKTLTGGEPVVARHLYHEQFVYSPTYKFFMTTNHKPRIKDTSLGVWRRLVLLPFEYTVPKDKIDRTLDEKIAAEYPGILNWTVAGFQKWMQSGLPVIPRLEKETACYQGQSDLLGQFLEENLCLTADPDTSRTSVVEFMTTLGEWCRENGVKYAPSRGAVIDYLARRGYGQPERDNSEGFRGKMAWKGVELQRKIAATDKTGWQ